MTSEKLKEIAVQVGTPERFGQAETQFLLTAVGVSISRDELTWLFSQVKLAQGIPDLLAHIEQLTAERDRLRGLLVS